MNFDTYLTLFTKINSKWITDLNIVLWNPESQTHLKRHSGQWSSLLCQRFQGESVPNKDPDVSERPSFIPPTM